jgi:hypothetical protein
MAIEMTPAYVATVGADHTIVVPEDIPIGTTVAVIVMPSESVKMSEEARHARFAETLAAIREASLQYSEETPISDADLDALIKKARKLPRE